MNGNLGRSGLKHSRRANDPMAEFDRLPLVLRQWLAGAALPWSPRSCRRVWVKSRAQGFSEAEALARLDQIEAAMLRDADAPARAA
ncbi:MAG: DUF6525 family protein [Dinoroseobacter sp.]|nr:DUF6525 family protein [Dinoroseobacter sp.]